MRVGIVTLGCDKNTVDNEYLAGLLARGGCELSVLDVEEEAPDGLDAVVVTTCGFIGNAKQQSVDSIVAMADRKRESGDAMKVYVAGCLSQRYGDELMQEIPEIDGLVGVGQFQELATMILTGARTGSVRREKPTVEIYEHLTRRRLEQTPHAFLKISDGCNHACTFCSIPSMKGKHKSVPPDIVLQEAQSLLSQGVRELNLVAQDLADYGRERGKDFRLPRMLREICALPGDFWVRCLYLYPGGITDEMLEVLATEPKIVPYVDMPLQHLDQETLHRMKRPYRDVNTALLVQRMRAAIPNLTLRTTMIVGFPGETLQAHRRMLATMEELQFDRLGVFQYSQEEDTPAGAMPGQIGRRTKQERWQRAMELQAEISARLNQARVGQRSRVLVESYDRDLKHWVGRSPSEAPEVDGSVYFTAPGFLPIGDFVTVDITHADTYDVYGQLAAPHS